MQQFERTRSDGIRVRTATAGDLDQVTDLLARRGEPADGVDLRLVAGDPDEGLASVLVADDGGRIVSTATLLRETVRIGTVEVPAAQVEMVATEPSHEGRGLVRSLMEAAHERSADRGDVLQVMIGIPFFYRLFGYVYSMPIPDVRTMAITPGTPDGVTVREGTPDDIAAMSALQRSVQSTADVAMPHSPGCWRWLVARDGSSQWVAERDGAVVATARLTPPDEGVYVGELAGEPDGLRALLARAAALAGPDAEVEVMGRPGTAVQDVLSPLLAEADDPDLVDAGREWFYARIERPAALFEALRPELGRRWVEAGGDERDVLISSYQTHLRFHLGHDGMGPVTAGGAFQAPISAGGSGVPHDVLAPLLLGPYGAAELERRHPDVLLGRQREVMTTLFPPQRSDLLTFYLPV